MMATRSLPSIGTQMQGFIWFFYCGFFREDVTTKNVTYLHEHGPSSNDDLPLMVDRHDRAAGVQKFTLRGNHGDAAKMGGRPTPIYFLTEHAKEAVLDRFLDANPNLVEAKPRHGLHRLIKSHGQDWLEAAREVTEEYYDEQEVPGAHASSYTEERTCDFCGDVIEGKDPHHLAEECEQAKL